jgi:hypothetical protein
MGRVCAVHCWSTVQSQCSSICWRGIVSGAIEQALRLQELAHQIAEGKPWDSPEKMLAIGLADLLDMLRVLALKPL